MDEALRVVAEKFRNLPFENIPARCGASLVDNKIKVRYLTKWYLLSPETITYLEEKEEVSKREKIIILHYITQGKGTPLTNKMIDFRDVPSGNMYYSVFEARVYRPFLDIFGKNPSLFIKAARALEGEKVDFGDIAFRFVVLPRIPINFVLHKGDEEFPPACKVLFDSSIYEYLDTEDIVAVCEDTVKELTVSSKL